MAIEIVRGTIQELMPPDKHGARSCRINDRGAILPRDLADKVKEGDNVVAAGIRRKDVLHAMAVKDFKLDKAAGVDCTAYVFLSSIGWIVFILLGVFSLNGIDRNPFYIEAADDIVSIAGLIFGIIFLRYFVQVIKATRRVTYASP